jgi:hypothetical protein
LHCGKTSKTKGNHSPLFDKKAQRLRRMRPQSPMETIPIRCFGVATPWPDLAIFMMTALRQRVQTPNNPAYIQPYFLGVFPWNEAHNCANRDREM